MSGRLVPLLLAAMAIGAAGCAPGPEPTPAAATTTGPAPSTAASPPAPSAVTPVRVRIPAIGVDSPVDPIGVDTAGALQPPEGTTSTGWYAAGPVPGTTGPAVLAGHVDSRTGPAVFYRLRELPAGARIEVDRSDGSTAAFVARRTLQTPKAAFPTADVYAPTPVPELRLITCGGTFDPAIGHYRDNVVVEAVAERSGTWTVPPRSTPPSG